MRARLADLAGDQLLRTAPDVLHEGIVVHDATGAVVAANPAAEKILALSRGQLLGRETHDPEWRATDAEGAPLTGDQHPAAVARTTGQPVRDFIMGVYAREDRFRWIKINAQPFVWGDSSDTFVAVTFIDITEEKRALDELREKNAVLSATLSALPDSFMLIDRSGAMSLHNAGADRMQDETNFNRQASLWDALEVQTPDGEVLPRDQWPSWRALHGDSIDNFEIRARPTGSGIPWRPLLISTRPLFHPDGTVDRAIVLARDITTEKRALDELREKNALLAGIIDILPDYFTVVDRSGKVLVENNILKQSKEAYVDGEGNSFAHLPIWDAVEETLPDGSLLPFEQRPYWRAFQGETIHNLELRVRMRGSKGDWHNLLISALPIPSTTGQVDQIMSLSRDVTELNNLRNARATDERMQALGTLAGGIAHDFNNLLTATISSASLILAQPGITPDIARLARLIVDSAGHGADLTRNLLSYARQRPQVPRLTNVNILVTRTVALLRPIIGDDIEITTHLDSSEPFILADSAQLTTALINLATNARDAIDGPGAIEITTACMTDDHGAPLVSLALRDSGPGIPESIRQRIFEPFFTTKGDTGGSGLGLSMVQGYIAQTGGSIVFLERNEIGAGLALVLPRVRGPAAPAEIIPEPAALDWAPRVLVVEDDKLVREALEFLLKDLGCVPFLTASGLEAVYAAQVGCEFDILLTDLNIGGGMDGIETARALATSSRPHRVIYFSGREPPPELATAPKGDFLRKPFTPSDLLALLQRRPASAA